ncbi:hypothetical protein GCM10010149_18700 [Nonomuraea roseoviolacea subsp. roseoviolacea]
MVVVTFNHRIGFEGYGHVAGAPDNRALLDQVAALRWVRENVAAFGGDPGKVTVFGQSAGAAAIACLLAMPAAEGLFGRAVAQSVSSMFVTPAHAARVTAEVERRLGRSPRDSAPEVLVAAGEDVATQVIAGDPGRWGPMGYAGLAFAPVVDGEVLPDTPWNALTAGAARDVELVVGFTRDEFRLFASMLGGRPVDLAGALATLAPGGAEEVYRRMRPEASDAELYEVLMSDWMFRMPSALLADAHTGTTYAYELTWSPTDTFRACHGLEVPLVFGNVGDEMAVGLTGGSPDLPKVSEQFVAAWTGFAATGDPGWPRHDPATAVTRLFDAVPSDAEDPEAASRALWSRTGFPVIG